MRLKIILSVLLLVVFAGCTREDTHAHKEVRLAVSSWVGYSPIHYADEKGWLKEADIDVIHSTSLNETVHYFQADLIDVFVSTQYEARVLNKNDLTHIMAIDRSKGGDMILSNKPLDTILKSKKIKTYLEMDSVNELVLEGFIKKYSLSKLNFELIHKNQLNVKNINPDTQEDIIVVTYEPYASKLKHNGFEEIASTKESDILVLDSLYASKEAINLHAKQINLLKTLIKKAFDSLKNDPEEFYDTIKYTLDDQSYEDFLKSLSQIEWLVNNNNKDINKLIKHHNIIPMQE